MDFKEGGKIRFTEESLQDIPTVNAINGRNCI